jgi:hypothetical protein
MPGTPWTGADFATVTANCEAMAAALTPSPLDDLETFVSRWPPRSSPRT